MALGESFFGSEKSPDFARALQFVLVAVFTEIDRIWLCLQDAFRELSIQKFLRVLFYFLIF